MSEHWAISGMDRTRDQVLRTQWMGRRLRRFEDAALVTGKGVFVDDLRLPEMLWIEFARSNHPRGRIVSLNTTDAENMPGVVAVLKAEAPGTLRPCRGQSRVAADAAVAVSASAGERRSTPWASRSRRWSRPAHRRPPMPRR